MLTREHGLVRAVIRVRGPGPSSGRVWNRSRVDLHLYPGRNLDTITQAHTLHAFCDVIAADYRPVRRAALSSRPPEQLAGEERPAARLHQLTVGALTALAEDRRPRNNPRRISLLRAMSLRRLDAIAQ